MHDKPDNIAQPVAVALVRKFLSALRDYPLLEEGQDCLARYVAKCSLSVEHAEAYLDRFTHICPTPQEIIDAAYDEVQRAKFEPPKPPIEEQWKAQGYTYDADYYKNLMASGQLKMSEGPREIDLLHAAVKRKLKLKTFAKTSIGEVWSTARSMGFPLNRYQREDADRWEAIQPRRETASAQRPAELAMAVGESRPPITAVDIEAARRKRAEMAAREITGRDATHEGDPD
jgi:hypothetical protein